MWRELLSNPWWTFDRATTGGWGLAYRGFNLAEATVWFVFAALVVRRWLLNRRSAVEVLYAIAFFTFGLSDVREAHQISAPLVLAKGINLVALLWPRNLAIHAWYPRSRLY
jgi:hypothetical protein